jgi:ABC-2 type transport system ATP-binding protein
MIEVQGFHKSYDRTDAVRGLTFRVQAGQVLGLVGHNGAGKTTTMRAIAGLLPPSSGRLRVAGFDVVEQPLEAKSRLAYLPDDPQLFNALTVGEHLQFTASTYRIANYRARASELLAFFDLSSKINAEAAELSRGMRQKLAICCAYLQDPSALLFDEPFTGLDPPAIRGLKESIRQHAQQGRAIVVSSHLLALVEDLCTHFLVLAAGEKRFLGTRDEMRRVFQRTNAEAMSLEDVYFHLTEDSSQPNKSRVELPVNV